MAPVKKKAKRRSIRYTPDQGDYAIVSYKKRVQDFQTDALGIILNESSTGSAIVLAHTDKLQEGDQFVVQVGRLEPLPATVIWRKELDKDVVKLGIRYDQ